MTNQLPSTDTHLMTLTNETSYVLDDPAFLFRLSSGISKKQRYCEHTAQGEVHVLSGEVHVLRGDNTTKQLNISALVRPRIKLFTAESAQVCFPQTAAVWRNIQINKPPV